MNVLNNNNNNTSLKNGRMFARLSRRSTAAAADGGFAAEVGRGQQISIDSCCCHAGAGRVNFTQLYFTAKCDSKKELKNRT